MLFIYRVTLYHITLASELCPEQVGCRLVDNGTVLACRNYIDIMLADVKDVVLCGYDNTSLYLNNVLKKLPNVENITVIRSNVTYLIGPLKENNITHLRIYNTTLKRIPDNLFTHMRNLQVLDVRNNSLDRLPARLKYYKGMKAIYLQNNKWNCSLDLIWALNLNRITAKDRDRLICHGEPYADKPVVKIAAILQKSQVNCPEVCHCYVVHVGRDLITAERLHPTVVVNCTSKGFTQLPPLLPEHTAILLLENNQIGDLTPLIENRVYRHVWELYLDNNRVDTIDNLEGSYWLSHFRCLSLRGNRLTKLPTYALDNALQQNPNMPVAIRLFLGANPWSCDCGFIPEFQEVLMKYEKQIVDIEDVRCSLVDGDKNSLTRVSSLSRNSICGSTTEYSIQALDLLNIILASLIVLILSKLGYDYYYFKKTGKLPWIVTKMP